MMKAMLWIGACLACAGTLDTAAGVRLLGDVSPSPSGSLASGPTVPDLAQITNPQPEILHYPNAPGYPQTWRLTLPSWIYLAMHLPQVIGQNSCFSCVWPITWASTLSMHLAAIFRDMGRCCSPCQDPE